MSVHQKTSETAARWFIRMQEAAPDATERSQFEAWLMQSPLHQQEFASISDAWHGIDNITELKKLAANHQAVQFLSRTKRIKKIKNAAAVLSLCLMIGIASLFGHQQYQAWQAAPTLQMASHTNKGQIVTHRLADGSEVTLNASSQIQVTFYRNQRHIDLLQGEAIFNVQKDPSRPFIVETNTAKIIVLGTRFAINKLSKFVRVSVDHGTVQVESKENASKLILTNGQVAKIENAKPAQYEKANAGDYFKFAKGIIVFNQADMTEIADVLSRYRQQNVIALGNASDKISAVFQAKDTETFITTLPKIANVKINHKADHTFIQASQ